MFRDLSDGKALGFMYQHDARWQDDYTTITIFDNGAEDNHYVEPYSRGIRIRVDQAAMTVELLTEYINPQHIYGMSQGSMQVLPNGNVLLGYGNTGAMTEFAANGTVLCDVHFGPQAWFGSGDIQSYRTFKFDWVGRPDSKPDVAVVVDDQDEDLAAAANSGGNLTTTSFYVSWNGDTEVRRWVLEGTDNVDGGKWTVLDDVQRDGFETRFVMGAAYPHFVKAKGLDRNRKVLTETESWNWKQRKASHFKFIFAVFETVFDAVLFDKVLFGKLLFDKLRLTQCRLLRISFFSYRFT